VCSCPYLYERYFSTKPDRKEPPTATRPRFNLQSARASGTQQNRASGSSAQAPQGADVQEGVGQIGSQCHSVTPPRARSAEAGQLFDPQGELLPCIADMPDRKLVPARRKRPRRDSNVERSHLVPELGVSAC
jgi:hypothetical protein